MKSPTPEQCFAAALILKRAARVDRADGHEDHARELERAAEIMEAKAFVGALASAWRKEGGVEASAARTSRPGRHPHRAHSARLNA